ncbi:MAG: glutathione S-transferase family protein [Hyphomonadaceae bacterium]
MAKPILYIGNKNYSSWSMRPWLALKWGGIDFDERVIPLGGPGYGKSQIAEILAVSPSGRVPALHDGAIAIHDSLAISEWAAERAPSLWPSDPGARALARAASAEMHSSFFALRRDLSMNIKRRVAKEPDWPEDTRADFARLFELWGDALQRSGGPWLFGARSITDAMYAPVVTRLRTYAVETPASLQPYCDALLNDGAFRDWERGALAETWAIPSTDELYR